MIRSVVARGVGEVTGKVCGGRLGLVRVAAGVVVLAAHFAAVAVAASVQLLRLLIDSRLWRRAWRGGSAPLTAAIAVTTPASSPATTITAVIIIVSSAPSCSRSSGCNM